MLFEMLQGEVVRDRWADEQVKESLDLCLSCKACKSECPTNVDVATYRAEFLSHYYETHRRPLHAHAFGKIDRWLGLASSAPRFANFVMTAPVVSALVRRALHVAPRRALPLIAPITFRAWAQKRGLPIQAATGERPVLLWTDTFTNYFEPRVGQAAVDVLEAAGFRVSLHARQLCCGRPLYDFGFLADARRYLTRVLDELAPVIDDGTPVVMLEPSCASVFRDELRNLFPRDERAKRLASQVLLLSEALERTGFQPPRLAGEVLLHGHCHHKAIMKTADAEALLRRTGATVQPLDAGCCGMAGPFGFDADKAPVAQAIGERVLLPAVRRAPAETLIVSDGFSCREQIRQSTGRRAVHTAEALQSALGAARNK